MAFVVGGRDLDNYSRACIDSWSLESMVFVASLCFLCQLLLRCWVGDCLVRHPGVAAGEVLQGWCDVAAIRLGFSGFLPCIHLFKSVVYRVCI